MIKWSEKYAVGIPVVDDQHKELFKLVEELAGAVKKGEEFDCGYLMARLEVYSLYHFTSEEQLMQKYGYPDIAEQLHEHKKFRLKILSLKEQCRQSDKLEARKTLLKYLGNWLKTHIMRMDLKYVPYFNERIEKHLT